MKHYNMIILILNLSVTSAFTSFDFRKLDWRTDEISFCIQKNCLTDEVLNASLSVLNLRKKDEAGDEKRLCPSYKKKLETIGITGDNYKSFVNFCRDKQKENENLCNFFDAINQKYTSEKNILFHIFLYKVLENTLGYSETLKLVEGFITKKRMSQFRYLIKKERPIPEKKLSYPVRHKKGDDTPDYCLASKETVQLIHFIKKELYTTNTSCSMEYENNRNSDGLPRYFLKEEI